MFKMLRKIKTFRMVCGLKIVLIINYLPAVCE